MKMDTVALAQCKANERKAAEYVAKVERKRKIEKRKKAVVGTFLAAFFIASCGIVGKNDLESEGIVVAKEIETEIIETESETELDITHTLNGKILYKNLIETEEGYRWVYDTYLSEGTEVTVEFNDNGTINPIDDIVLDVYRR